MSSPALPALTGPLPSKATVPEVDTSPPPDPAAASSGPVVGSDGDAAPPARPVRLQPSLFPHKEATVYIEYAPFIGAHRGLCSRDVRANKCCVRLPRVFLAVSDVIPSSVS